MKTVLVLIPLLWGLHAAASDGSGSTNGLASWYGEAHRGKPMANGQPFDPDQLTAASWFYPLGTVVRVTLASDPQRSVVVTITDRGPARRLVRAGRVIDLSRAAFAQLTDPDVGLVEVKVEAHRPVTQASSPAGSSGVPAASRSIVHRPSTL